MKSNPYGRMAATVVWLVVAGFILIGLLNLGVYWLKTYHDHESMKLGRILLLSWPLLVGIGIAIKSSALVRWVDEYLND